MMQIDELTAADAIRLRTIRLRALTDAPDAFGETLHAARARRPEEWTQQSRFPF